MWYSNFVDFFYFNLYLLAFIIAIAFILVIFFSLLAKSKEHQVKASKGKLELSKLGERYKKAQEYLMLEVLDKKEYKEFRKEQKKKLSKEDVGETKKIFVLTFKGDLQASQVESLREEVSSVLSIAKTMDEVIVRVDSPGGVVNGYGFAAAQLERIRQAGINLTVCIDQIAASGGYMMASVAHKIICSPFAIVGSIGVVGTVPNVRDMLKKHGVDVEMHTSGQYKRTLTTVGENTEEGREKFKEDLQNIHYLFKKHILTYRPNLDIEKVATGEHWFGKDALELGLVDKIQTYDDYIIDYFRQDIDAYEISFVRKKDKGFIKSKLALIKRVFANILYNRNVI
ncbi:protease SohB [Pseudofrancisella aestuarii]|uniref:Protease SohB n=1 Tax=Pseudofrancisella aestuarii TaxID=2670347 RepID=A0ABV9TA14_9GAMM|nr:protease SohB [Pseudofrancisella aestuarii]